MSVLETGDKLEIKRLYGLLRESSLRLTSYLSSIPPDESQLTGANFINFSKAYDVMSYNELIEQVSIFSTYKLKVDQDAKSPLRLPSVWQFKDSHAAELRDIISCVNTLKESLSLLNDEMKINLPKGRSNKLWHEIIPSVSILQVLRKVVLIDSEISYIGLTYLSKPIVKKLSLDDAQTYLNDKAKQKPYATPIEVWLDTIDKAKESLSRLNTKRYGIRLARKGALRPMVNCQFTQGKDIQVMASLPVIVATSQFHNVGMPLKCCDKPRKARSDKKISIGDTNLFGLYAMKV